MPQSSPSVRRERGFTFRALPTWSFGLVIAAVTALALLFAQSSQGADPRTATAVGTELTIDDVPALGVGGFSGTYVTAGTPDLSQSSGQDTGDYSDPDGVGNHVGAATELVHTSWDATSGQLTARANATAFTMKYNGVTDFVTIGSLDAYAQCVKESAILAYSRSNTGIIVVAGTNFTEGTRTVNVTGPQLGLSAGITGTMTVEYEQFQSVVNTATEASAEAYVRLVVTVDLKNADGTALHSGRIIDLTVGHVKVSCQPRVAPSPSTSDASPTQSPTTVPTADPYVPTVDPSPSTESPSPTDNPTPSPSSSAPTPSPQPTGSDSPPDTGTPNPTTPNGGGNDDDDDGLAVTGSTAVLIALSGVGVAMIGVGLLALARHRRESRC